MKGGTAAAAGTSALDLAITGTVLGVAMEIGTGQVNEGMRAV